MNQLIERLSREHTLREEEYYELITGYSPLLAQNAASEAVCVRKQIYGTDVYVRGLIEFSNICKNDCYYCGIRCGNQNADRYRLTKEEIYSCCENGYALGFRTFVLQGGEDPYFDDDKMCDIIRTIRKRYPDCAITLSLGERSYESFKNLYDAGANRYLLRHETISPSHYEKLHPNTMSHEHRMQCLHALKDIGYQVGCGFMVGSPYQTPKILAKELKFIEEFQPDMCGIGPFISHKDTPFSDCENGSVEMTCYLLSLIRLIKPNILLPATTALGTINARGRELGILSGANVVMPNLSPVKFREKYELYDNKICTGEEAAECRTCLENRIKAIGYQIVSGRGDIKK